MKKRLVFATSNPNKVAEVKAILGEQYEILSLKDIGCEEDIPETSPSFEGNALQKARYVKEHYQLDCFAEDTGLEVDALNGEPGVFTARYAGEQRDAVANMELVLQKLAGQSNRSARFKTAIALIAEGQEYTFEGTVEGRIGMQRSGEGGFGYDPIFIPDGEVETFGEMDPIKKHGMSHRAVAFEKMLKSVLFDD